MTCPVCRAHVDRVQPSDPRGRGPWIAHPCNHWITRSQVVRVVWMPAPKESGTAGIPSLRGGEDVN